MGAVTRLLNPKLFHTIFSTFSTTLHYITTYTSQVVGAVTKALAVDDKKEAILVGGNFLSKLSN